MLKRNLIFMLGAVLLADALLPPREESLQVIDYAMGTRAIQAHDLRSVAERSMVFAGRNYSCPVEGRVEHRIKVGDVVVVRSSKIFRSCLSISKAGEEIVSSPLFRPILFISGSLFIAGAMGFIRVRDS